MSVRITSAQLDPQSVATGAGCRLVVGAEAYGVFYDYFAKALVDSTGALLLLADDQDYFSIDYDGDQIDALLRAMEGIEWLNTN